MTAADMMMFFWVAVIGLSLLGIVLIFVLGVGSGLRTVGAAARRARNRPTAFGPLAVEFAERTLVQLDEALERVWLEERPHGAPPP